MEYLKFQSKKVLKNNLIVISLVILLLLCFWTLYMNASVKDELSLEGQAKGNIALENKTIKQMKNDLKHQNKNGDLAKLTRENISDTQKQLLTNKNLLSDLKQKKWLSVYSIQLKNAQEVKKVQSKNKISQEEKDGIEQNIALFTYLKKHPLPYESDSATTGIQFFLDLNQKYFPFLFVIVIIFILIQLYSSSYKNKLDIANLLPLKTQTLVTTNLLTGILITLGIYLFLNVLLFGGASLIFGTGSLDYPFLTYIPTGKNFLIKYAHSGDILFKALILEMLVIVFLVSISLLFTTLIKDKLPALLLAILLVPGLSLATIVLDPLQKIARWLPTTYLNTVGIVSGQFAHQINNLNLNFETGCITLFASIVIICILFLAINRDK